MELTRGLAEEVVRTFGQVRLRVVGTSMAPSIVPGDLVLVKRAGAYEVSNGEIVLFVQKGRFFVHRVVDRKLAGSAESSTEMCLITRGDRLRQNDPPVTSSELLGRVVCVERASRKVDHLARQSNSILCRLLRASDRFTYVYLRLAAYWRALSPGRDKCLV